MHVEDIRADPDSALPEAVASGRRTMLGVPLVRDSEPIGVIVLARQRVEPFTERQIELVRTFADQAVIAIENARLLGELQARTRDLEESLEYQTATSDVLNVIARSTGDVQPVLDTVVETATRLCGADTGNIVIREGEVYRSVSNSSSAADAEYYAALRQRTFVPSRDSLTGRVLLEGRVVHVADIRAIPDYPVPEAVASGRRTNLVVPLLRGGEVLGTINFSRKRVEPFTERQIELVRTFADQAVIAIENARLLTELRESLEQQTATAEVLQVINSSPGDLAPVFDAMLERAMRLCGASFGTFLTYDGEFLHFVAARGHSRYGEWARQQGPIGVYPGTTNQRLLRGKAVVQLTDLPESEAYRLGQPGRRAQVDIGGFRTLLSVALCKDAKLLGTLHLHRLPRSRSHCCRIRRRGFVPRHRPSGAVRRRTPARRELPCH